MWPGEEARDTRYRGEEDDNKALLLLLLLLTLLVLLLVLPVIVTPLPALAVKAGGVLLKARSWPLARAMRARMAKYPGKGIDLSLVLLT